MVAHPPKVEYFDVAAGTNTDPKGVVRQVEQYRTEPWGLYMARTSDHPKFDYLQSWIVPELGVRVSIFHFLHGHIRDQDHYIDLGRFTVDGSVWTSVDHYLDIVVRTGIDSTLIDVDELLEAHLDGVLAPDVVERTILEAATAMDGIAAAGHDVDAWLAKSGMVTSWRPFDRRPARR